MCPRHLLFSVKSLVSLGIYLFLENQVFWKCNLKEFRVAMVQNLAFSKCPPTIWYVDLNCGALPKMLVWFEALAISRLFVDISSTKNHCYTTSFVLKFAFVTPENRKLISKNVWKQHCRGFGCSLEKLKKYLERHCPFWKFQLEIC